ncbi:hypothetical protein QNI19_15525 [Cytophagaceae bacterium DM2B3-1]|uniref:Uncharacterized protein n=1 Tax=Xanthocytophaga flava TaxID=3048013 RepID=A0ABT7CKX9_9BACT|nr:hypothetical protein [Xanthocytophaga flavus]MDJ1494353.1 hypothetical protein [Xanthocytophaga flavus]
MDITIQKLFDDSHHETGIIITAAVNAALTLQSKEEIEQYLKDYASSLYARSMTFYSEINGEIASLACIWNQSALPRTSTFLPLK